VGRVVVDPDLNPALVEGTNVRCRP